MMWDILYLGLKNIKNSPVRTCLASSIITLAVVLVLVFSAMEYTVISHKEIKAHSQYELRQLTIYDYSDHRIAVDDLLAIQEINSVEGVLLDYNIPGYEQILIDNVPIDYINGLWGAHQGFDLFDRGKWQEEELNNPSFIPILLGRAFEKDQDAYEVILPGAVFRQQGSDLEFNLQDLIGRDLTLTINECPITANIVGIYSYKLSPHDFMTTYDPPRDFVGFDSNSFPILLNEPFAKKAFQLHHINEAYIPHSALITVRDIAQVEETASIIEDRFGYYVHSDITAARQVVDGLFFYRKLLGTTALFVFVIAMISIINTMFMVLRERVRFIAVLKMLGFTKSDIVCILSTEAILIGLIGALTGIIFSYVIQGMISVIISNLLDASIRNLVSFQMPHSVILRTLLSSVLLAWLAGLIPAILGSRMQPLSCLKW